MKIQRMSPSVGGEALAVPPVVTVIVSPDPQEIDMHLQSDPLAVDPLLVRAEDIKKEIKKEIKQEKVLDKCDTQIKDEEIDETSSMKIVKPMTVLVPSVVSLEEELTSQCVQEKDPLENIHNLPLPKSVLEEMESRITLQVSSDETTSTHKSSSESSSVSSNEKRVQAPILVESVNEPSEKQGLDMEGANLGRVTRKSAAVARAKIRRIRWSKEDSSSSASDFDDSDQDYQSSDIESSDESSKDVCSRNENRNQHQRVWLKDALPSNQRASWCSCGMHSPSVLDNMMKEMNMINGHQQNGLSQPSQLQQVSRVETTSTLKSSRLLSPMPRNEEHGEVPTLGESGNEPSEKQVLDMEGVIPGHVIQKSTAVNYQLSDVESSDVVGSRKEDHDPQKRDCPKGIQHDTSQWRFSGMYSPRVLDNMNMSVHLHNGHQQNVLAQSPLKDQLINQVALRNEDDSINLNVKCIAPKSLLSASSYNADHEMHAKKQTSGFVGIKSNTNNVSLGSKNTVPLTKTDLVKHNSVPSNSRIHLETAVNVRQKKIIDGNDKHPCVNKNIASDRNVLFKSPGLVKNVSDNCESSPVFNDGDNDVMLIMDIESNKNNVHLGSKNTLPSTEKVSDNWKSSPIVNDDYVMLVMYIISKTNHVNFVTKKTLPIPVKDFVNHNSAPSDSRINFETLRSVLQNKILEDRGQHPIVNENEVLSERSVLIGSHILENVSDNCESSSVVDGKHVNLILNNESNTNNAILKSKNSLPLTEDDLVKPNCVPSKSRIHLETAVNVLQKKSLDDNGQHPFVNKNSASERSVLFKSPGALKNVSDNCKSSLVVKDDNVMLIMDVESNTNNVSLGSKNTLPLSENAINKQSVPSESRIHLETVVNVLQKKILDDIGQHPFVNKNSASERQVLLKSPGALKNVSDNCKSSSVVNDDNMLRKGFLLNRNVVNLRSNDLVKPSNLVTDTNCFTQTPGKLIQKKVLENDRPSSVANCDHDMSDCGVDLENAEEIIHDNSFNSNQLSSVSSKSVHLEDQRTMSHLTVTHLKKPENMRKCIENCKSECTKHLRKLTKRKAISDLETNQYGQTLRKRNLKDCVDRCPKDGRKLTNCPVCDIRIKECRLAQHSLKHSDHRPHKCKLCPKAFKTIYYLQSHSRHKHENTFFKCNYCEKQYKGKSNFRRHVKIHKGIDPPKFKCDICGKLFEKANMIQHIKSHSTDYQFACNICDKKFKNKVRLTSHISRVHNSKPGPRHICDICGVIKRSPSALADHMNIHSNNTPYTCDVCGKSFPVRRRLDSHLVTHGEKKYKCDICGYTCNRFDNLSTHIRSHTGEKPFKCFMCSQTFTRLDNLQTHKRGVHKVK